MSSDSLSSKHWWVSEILKQNQGKYPSASKQDSQEVSSAHLELIRNRLELSWYVHNVFARRKKDATGNQRCLYTYEHLQKLLKEEKGSKIEPF